MKLSIELDLTPQDARELLGLPDVKTLQDQWLEKTGLALLSDPENFSPEMLINNWTKAAAPGFDAMPAMFQMLMKSGFNTEK